MIRKDPAQDFDRPHFYSQFWVDVASGKRDVSEAHSADAELIGDGLEEEEVAPPPIDLAPKPAPKKVAKPEKKPEPVRPTITSLADLANIDLLMKNSAEMAGDEVPDLEAGAMDDLAPFGQPETGTEPEVSDFDYEVEEPEAAAGEDEEEFDFDEDEDEEEDEWGSRRPGKPGKQQQKPRRERRPNF
jgi:hypothetical protein